MSKNFELSGVYIITNKADGKFYVGSGKSIFSRWFNHTCALKNENHVNYKLQEAVKEYGLENFKFEILELHPPHLLNQREQFYLDTLCKAQEYIKGESNYFIHCTYNIKPLVWGTPGLPNKDESIVKGIRTRGFGVVLKVHKNGGVMNSYQLQCDAADDNFLNRTTVSNSIKNKRCPKDKDFYFVYEDEYDETYIPKICTPYNKGQKGVVTHPENYKEVYAYDIYGRFFKKFESNTSVANYFNVDTSSTCRMLDRPKKKVLHREGIHLYNLFSESQVVETLVLDAFNSVENSGNIKVFTLFHEYLGTFTNETIAQVLGCHLHSVSQAITQQKILKGFYFMKKL
jgi:hypothetical protein